MSESHIMSEVTGFPVKPLPGPTRWLQRVLWPVMGLSGFSITVFTNSYIPLGVAIVITLLVTIAIVCDVRCPQCRSRLDPREVEEMKNRKRLYYDCATCEITWQSELLNQEES